MPKRKKFFENTLKTETMILSHFPLGFCYPGCQNYSHRNANIRKHQLCNREHRAVLSNSSFIWVEHQYGEFLFTHRTQHRNNFLCSSWMPSVLPLPYSASNNCKAMMYIKDYLDISKEVYRNTLIAPRWMRTVLWQTIILQTV